MLNTMRAIRRRDPLARRSTRRELLDRGLVDPRELERNLADLARMNRLPGGTAASVEAIRRLVEDAPAPSLLDVGTGGADMPIAFARQGWQVTAVDSDADVLNIARANTRGDSRITLAPGNAAALPFESGSFDVTHCSLLMHHLDRREAVGALREMARVARRGVVVNDLRRGWLPLLVTATVVAALGRCRTTRHDGLLSVRRAYRIGEIDGLFAAAGLHVVGRSQGWLPRVVSTAVRMSSQ